MTADTLTTGALAWALVGLGVGANRASTWPGPQDSVVWAVIWVFAWPLLWILED